MIGGQIAHPTTQIKPITIDPRPRAGVSSFHKEYPCRKSPEITAKSWLMVLFLGFVWGGTFLFQNLALNTTPPFWVASARIVFAGLLTFAVWRFRGGRLFTTDETDWPRLIAIGALSTAIPFMFLSWGQQHVTSAFAGVSMATSALFVLPLAHFLVAGERMTWRRAFGFALGFAGVIVLIGPKCSLPRESRWKRGAASPVSRRPVVMRPPRS